MHLQDNIQAKVDNLRQHLLELLSTKAQSLSLPKDKKVTLSKLVTRLNRPLSEPVSAPVNTPVKRQALSHNPLDDLIKPISASSKTLPKECAVIINSLTALAEALPWYQRQVARNPAFMDGHVNAQIIGPEGLEVRQDVIVGVTLMRENLPYPDHEHEPEELYLVLSDGRWRQENGPWHTPGLGGLVHNKSGVMHGMKSQTQPFIALWCLPLDKPFKPFSAPLSDT